MISTLPSIECGREVCGDLAQAEQREWLVTNSIGGYAAGTIGGILTRHYHGLLIAALKPPLQRTLLVTKIEETVQLGDTFCPFYSDRFQDGEGQTIVTPQGYRFLESFALEGAVPRWCYTWGMTQLEKRVWMAQGENTTYVQYRLGRGQEPITLHCKILVNYRSHHFSTTAQGWQMQINPVAQGLQIQAFEGATPFYLFSPAAVLTAAHEWQRGYDLSVERYRGIPPLDDHLVAATTSIRLIPGETIVLVFSTEPNANLDGVQALHDRHLQTQDLLDRYEQSNPPPTPEWVKRLVIAADQFVVDREIEDVSSRTISKTIGKTIIAGYPWFGDWGRDTMISLPGLTLSTHRPDIARPILQTFGRYLSQGMLPNVFPEANHTPDYNTVDATLWYIQAIVQYYGATQDHSLLAELFPALESIVDWHLRGTRYHIQWDARDGLLYAGEPGVQLTWMDAKVGDWVVTPRIGKPVEINALWYNALVIMQFFAQQCGGSPERYAELAALTHQGFQRFWFDAGGYCYDVIDSPDMGYDSALRPNQLFAITLPQRSFLPFLPHNPPLLTPQQSKTIVDHCGRHLLTGHGLRSLSPTDPNYCGHYGGSPLERDRAYHQGTVWGWLLGTFAEAHFQVYGDGAVALSVLPPLAAHLQSQCLGTLGEIFEGDPPFLPRGAFAQAWTVAEMLRVWRLIAGSPALPGLFQ